METVVTVVSAVPPLIEAIIVVAGLCVAAYQAFKKAQYKRGFELTDETLRGLIAAIELLPDSPEKTKVAETIEKMANTLGTQSGNLDAAVRNVRSLLIKAGVLTSGDDTAQMMRAAEAVSRFREAKSNAA